MDWHTPPIHYITGYRAFIFDIMKLDFDIDVNYDASTIEISDDDFQKGVDEIKQLFYDYSKFGIMPRIGEKLIPMADTWYVSVVIKSICYCSHKIMIDCDCR